MEKLKILRYGAAEGQMSSARPGRGAVALVPPPQAGLVVRERPGQGRLQKDLSIDQGQIRDSEGCSDRLVVDQSPFRTSRF